MDRMIQANVIAMSGRAVEAAGRRGRAAPGQDRHHHPGQPAGDRVPPGAAASPAKTWPMPPSSPRWPTRRPEGRSIVVLAKEKYGLRERDLRALGATFVPFTAQTRMSGVNLDGRQIRKGAADAIEAYVKSLGGAVPAGGRARPSTRIAKEGGTPLVVADGAKTLGRDPSQGHRQGRHQGAVRRAAAHGHQDRHDHRRQPADGRGHRRRGRRGRLPGAGHARGQAQAHPRHPGRRAAWSP